MSFLARYGYIGIAKKIENSIKSGKYKDDNKRKIFYSKCFIFSH